MTPIPDLSAIQKSNQYLPKFTLKLNSILILFSWISPDHSAQGCSKNLEPSENQESGCGGQDQKRDPEPQAFQASTHYQTLPGNDCYTC